jgi:hypothetical protein
MKNENIKTPRASQTRTAEKRPTTWTPPSSLDAPRRAGLVSDIDGFVLEILGFDDDLKHVSGKIKIRMGVGES